MSDLTQLFACIPHSKNPANIEIEYNLEIDKIYEDLKNSDIPREEDIAYDEKGTHTKIDIWGPQKTEKLLIMIHGGYWLFGSRKKCLAIVKPAQKLGYTVASIGYDFADQKHPLPTTIEETMRGIEFTISRFSSLNPSSNLHIVIAGHSVGAHLALKSLDKTSARNSNFSTKIHAAYLIAGLFELSELVATDYGRQLGLTPEHAQICSCDLNHLENFQKIPIFATCGTMEAPKLYEQNMKFKNLAENVRLKIYEGEDHFSVLTYLNDVDSEICKDFMAFLRNV
ncbi:unnamed protein product [Caenorhabditis angaria]|uniref:BD-FAE-like domain-containing protein n=1 Tax=Caenorhabditis angaria TaxID=860376 RepID=A0A9P1ILB5_9PELO|nr:unnamed protein product [Caenorhabditis angaria]